MTNFPEYNPFYFSDYLDKLTYFFYRILLYLHKKESFCEGHDGWKALKDLIGFSRFPAGCGRLRL